MKKEDEQFLEIFEETEIEEEKPSILSRAIKSLVALTAIVGLLYISGIQQALFYRETPRRVNEVEILDMLDAPELLIPLNIFVLRNEINGSKRTEEGIEHLVLNASRVWEQASVRLIINNVVDLSVDDEEMRFFLNYPSSFIFDLDNTKSPAIDVFLTRRLGGINGIAFISTKSVAVADLTTVYDFRVLAHEVGHILGLVHVGEAGQLMYQGANGINLTADEVMRARERLIILL